MNTVSQISTPIGMGGISIIKVSGNEAVSIVNKIFNGKDLLKVKTHTLNYGYIIEDNIKIDEVLVSVMFGPNTSTGEDVVEINCHGGILITNKILKLLIKSGAQIAEPGEFSKRAFLNGKKDLEESQNIMDMIHAKNNEALKLAIGSLNNSSKVLIEELREKLLNIVTNIEVNIDYPEYEDIEIIENENVLNEIDKFEKLIKEIISDSQNKEIIKNGIDTAIIGKPNVGKSSILNLLSKNEKAIVTNIAGTTRDTIESEIQLDKLTLNLIDTAGIRNTTDVVEKIGVSKSLELIEKSDLILFVLDNTEKINDYEAEIFTKIRNSQKPYIIIINKSDQKSKIDLNKIDIKIEDTIKMSTIDKTGIKELSSKIEELFNLQYFDATTSKHIANIENLSKLEIIKEKVEKIKLDLSHDIFLDLILIDLKDCIFILGEILGLEVKDDYLNEIFSRFCLGK